ncbi:hypothetical protein [Sorangium cellulosum]|nr:hypothetical protein [Sorangium cellulosum]
MAGGALVGAPEKDTLCKAFENASNEWCKLSPDQRKQQSFNDYFFKHLNDPKSVPGGGALASQMSREVPGIMGRGRNFAGWAQNLAAQGASAGPAGNLASAMLSAAGAATLGVSGAAAVPHGAQDAARFASRNAFWNHLGVNPNIWQQIRQARAKNQRLTGAMWQAIKKATHRPVFADAVYKNRVMELKAPGDRLTDAQAKDAQAMSGGNDPYVVSCKACGLRCASRCPKSLPIKKAAP